MKMRICQKDKHPRLLDLTMVYQYLEFRITSNIKKLMRLLGDLSLTMWQESRSDGQQKNVSSLPVKLKILRSSLGRRSMRRKSIVKCCERRKATASKS